MCKIRGEVFCDEPVLVDDGWYRFFVLGNVKKIYEVQLW